MVVIEMVCTDRNGVRLASTEIIGVTYLSTLKERTRIADQFRQQFRDRRGDPYIFRHLKSA